MAFFWLEYYRIVLSFVLSLEVLLISVKKYFVVFLLVMNKNAFKNN